MSRDRSDSLQVDAITAVGIQQQLPHQIEADRSLKILRGLTEMLLTALEQGGALLIQDRTQLIHGEVLVGMARKPVQQLDGRFMASFSLTERHGTHFDILESA